MSTRVALSAAAAGTLLVAGVAIGVNSVGGDATVEVEPVWAPEPEPEPAPDPEPEVIDPRWDNDGLVVHPLEEPTSYVPPAPAVEVETETVEDPAVEDPAPESEPDGPVESKPEPSSDNGGREVEKNPPAPPPGAAEAGLEPEAPAEAEPAEPNEPNDVG